MYAKIAAGATAFLVTVTFGSTGTKGFPSRLEARLTPDQATELDNGWADCPDLKQSADPQVPNVAWQYPPYYHNGVGSLSLVTQPTSAVFVATVSAWHGGSYSLAVNAGIKLTHLRRL